MAYGVWGSCSLRLLAIITNELTGDVFSGSPMVHFSQNRRLFGHFITTTGYYWTTTEFEGLMDVFGVYCSWLGICI